MDERPCAQRRNAPAANRVCIYGEHAEHSAACRVCGSESAWSIYTLRQHRSTPSKSRSPKPIMRRGLESILMVHMRHAHATRLSVFIMRVCICAARNSSIVRARPCNMCLCTCYRQTYTHTHTLSTISAFLCSIYRSTYRICYTRMCTSVFVWYTCGLENDMICGQKIAEAYRRISLNLLVKIYNQILDTIIIRYHRLFIRSPV